MSIISALRVATGAVAALVLLAGCSSTVGGSAVPGTSATSTSGQSTSAGSTSDMPTAPSTVPSLGSLVIPAAPSASTSATDDGTGRSTQSATSSPASPTSTPAATSATPETPTAATTTSASPSSTAPATTGAPATSTGASSPTDPFAGATQVDPSDYPGLVTPVGFSSPSGNITCGYQPTKTPHVTCQIHSHTYPNPSPDCQGAGPTGGAIGLSLGGAPEFECDGDVESGGPVLAYGHMISVAGLECVSRENGITCRDPKTSNGFRIAKASYELMVNGRTTGASAAATPPSNSLSKFTGSWGGHGRQLTFVHPGTGNAVYRSYVWCSDNPNPPCDSTKNNQIVAGGKLTVTLTSATGGTNATGTVTASNDPAFPVGTHVGAVISGYNLTLSIWPDAPFCAANTPSDKWNCGA